MKLNFVCNLVGLTCYVTHRRGIKLDVLIKNVNTKPKGIISNTFCEAFCVDNNVLGDKTLE